MNYQNPFKISDVNLDNIIYKTIKETHNRKIIFIKYKNNTDDKNKNLVFQLPTLYNNLIINDKDIDIPINCKDEKKNTELVDFFNKLDSKIIGDIKKNKSVWFSHIKNKTEVNYHYIIRNDDKPNRSIFRVKYVNSQ
jgi:hypothetical protein